MYIVLGKLVTAQGSKELFLCLYVHALFVVWLINFVTVPRLKVRSFWRTTAPQSTSGRYMCMYTCYKPTPPFLNELIAWKGRCYTCTRGGTNKWRQASSKHMTRAAIQNHHMPCIYAYIHRAWLTGVWGGHINFAREKYHNSQKYIHFIFLAVMVVLSCKYSRKRCIFRDYGSVSQSLKIMYRSLCPKYRWRPE